VNEDGLAEKRDLLVRRAGSMRNLESLNVICFLSPGATGQKVRPA